MKIEFESRALEDFGSATCQTELLRPTLACCYQPLANKFIAPFNPHF